MGNFDRSSLSGRASDNNNIDDDEDSAANRTLWIGGGISQQVDEEMLFEMFNNAGPVEDVRIPMDKERNQYKNYAFITFHHEESVSYAIALFDRVRLFGKELILKQSTGAGNSYNRSSGKQHTRSISAPGMANQKISNHNSHPSSMYNNHQSLRQRNIDMHTSRYPSQQNYNNYSNSKHYDDYSSRGDGSERYHHYSRNSYGNDRRDRRYDRRSYHEYDRYRR